MGNSLPMQSSHKDILEPVEAAYIQDEKLVRRFYCLDDTQLYVQVELPRAYRPDVMGQMHEGLVGGHFGVERTVAGYKPNTSGIE